MTLLHQAAQKAVEALTTANGILERRGFFVEKITEAIAAIESALQQPEPVADGYVHAFYEMARMLGIEGAQAKSPQQVYVEQIKPALQRALQHQEVPREPVAEALEAFDHELSNWARAYPESVFPEPDLTLARTALEARGLTIDCVSASNMRHVVKTLNKLFQPVRDALAAAPFTTQQAAPKASIGAASGPITEPQQATPSPSTTQQQEVGNEQRRGRLNVAVALLRECIGPLEVSAGVIESDDGDEMEHLIGRVRKFVKDADLLAAAPSTAESSEKDDAGGVLGTSNDQPKDQK